MRFPWSVALVICSLALLATAWTKEDHEIFRLRDEVLAFEGDNVTFYDFLGVKPGASQDEIRKAYKKKSRLIHPDKAKQSFIASRSTPQPQAKSGQQASKKKPGVRVSKGPSESEIKRAVKQANERFARLSVVSKVLTGPDRERYDHFLKNGFPKWRGTGYYYARYRPGIGSVLLGLFVFGGGAVHYLVLYLSWKRQREFVGRYIRHARRAAWGDDLGIKGLPNLGESAVTSGVAEDRGEGPAQPLNRRQRRIQEKEREKESKKGKAAKEAAAAASETTTVKPGPSGDKKRVVAENGKVLVVDSVGNVYLEEENEEGQVEEYLLDIDEIPRPTIKQTVLVRLPIWLYTQATDRVTAIVGPSSKPATEGPGSNSSSSDSSSESDEVNVDTQVPSAPNGRATRQAQKRGNAR